MGKRKEIKEIYNLNPIRTLKKNSYEGIIIAVAHKKFKTMGLKNILNLGKKNSIIYDLKSILPKNKSTIRL